MKEIVIAAYDRGYDWVKSLDSNIKVTVYRKGEEKIKENEILIEPNLGRDIHTFFTHLYTRYDTLSDVTFFSQDYPFDHVSNYVDIINGDNNTWDSLAHQYNEGCWFFCTQYGVLKCNSIGAPHHPNLNLSKMWEKLFKSTPCPSEFSFTPTGHFAITNKQATKIPKSYYKLIIDILENEPNSPWEIERLEPYIFLR
tara:strand:- start:1826 stop:2416 length:591 start_codon:yes stop_codon:yes gene_type:complete